MSLVKRTRRLYLLQRLAAHERCEYGLEAAFRAKQEEQNIKQDGVTPVAPFPSDFPFKATLEASGYYVVEDVDGADCNELRENAGLDQSAAQAVIAAAAALI